jgi:hypothetical protein
MEWSVYASAEGTPVLTRGVSNTPRNFKELTSPSAARVLLIATDCISPIWTHPSFVQWLSEWGSVHPTCALQLLPQRLWGGTKLRASLPTLVRSERPMQPNSSLKVLSKKNNSDIFGEKLSPPIVVATLRPNSIKNLVTWLTGNQGSMPAFSFRSGARGNGARQGNGELDPTTVFSAFRTQATAPAFKLACILAAAPLTMPIMALLQRLMLPYSDQTHLAEVLNSGLVKIVRPGTDEVTADSWHRYDASSVEYDFIHDDLRGMLLSGGRLSDALAAHRRVSDYISQRLGGANFIRASVAGVGVTGDDFSGPMTFAKVSASVLRAYGVTQDGLIGESGREAADDPKGSYSDLEGGKAHHSPGGRSVRQIQSAPPPRLNSVMREMKVVPEISICRQIFSQLESARSIR